MSISHPSWPDRAVTGTRDPGWRVGLTSDHGHDHTSTSVRVTQKALTGLVSFPASCAQLLKFLRRRVYAGSMNLERATQDRPDVVAATRGGDVTVGMDGEADPATASLELALFWRTIYTEILAMEEAVLERIRELMADQSPQARREVELTNLPVVVAQAGRFRSRLGFWEACVRSRQQPA